ncbi:alpha/beta hydrolase [Poseidonocella sp. HB161398]|uniref:alpha/beta hydrolase n=1 Tax=Poseidonocella sp. HB161398 TaxID=2320855 RepID=UPI001107C596|nr:alpha/beta fold hydrolase [Poseidonocella sp. HB161398]
MSGRSSKITRRRFAASAAAAALTAGCAPRGSIFVDPASAKTGNVRDILVATTREPTDDGRVLSGSRASTLRFYDFAVSVPPDRETGTVRFPTSAPPDPQTDFLTVRARQLGGPAAFRREINARAAIRAPKDREAVAFVHGFNTNFAEGLYRHAQISHDFRNRAISVHFSWPSAAHVSAYAYDRESVLVSRDGLAATLDETARSSVPRIVVMAHSMGAHLTMETLRQMAIRGAPQFFGKLAAIVLMAPDVDVDVFRSQVGALGDIDVPIYIFVSNRDRALQFSSLLRGRRQRLGSVTDAGSLSDLPVAVIDISRVGARSDPLQHFKVASSPTMIDLFSGMGTAGLDMLQGGETPSGILGSGIEILQTLAGAVPGVSSPN